MKYRGCLGHPPAETGRRLREFLLQPAHQLGGRGRSAVADALERGEVVLLERGMGEQLPGDGRHAAGAGNALAFDDLQRQLRVPFVHEHELAASGDERDHHGVASGRMEQRDRQQIGLLRGVGIGRGHRFAAAQESSRLRIRPCHDGRAGVAMGADRALRLPGRARGVEEWWRRHPDRAARPAAADRAEDARS